MKQFFVMSMLSLALLIPTTGSAEHGRNNKGKHNANNGHRAPHSSVTYKRNPARVQASYRTPIVHVNVGRSCARPVYYTRFATSYRPVWRTSVYDYQIVTGRELMFIENTMINSASDDQAINKAERLVRNQALTVHQLGILMQTLQYDDARLDLVYALYGNLQNPGQLYEIYRFLSRQSVHQLERTFR